MINLGEYQFCSRDVQERFEHVRKEHAVDPNAEAKWIVTTFDGDDSSLRQVLDVFRNSPDLLVVMDTSARPPGRQVAMVFRKRRA